MAHKQQHRVCYIYYVYPVYRCGERGVRRYAMGTTCVFCFFPPSFFILFVGVGFGVERAHDESNLLDETI